MIKKCTFFILPFCVALFVLQSCWKDESLKDKTFDDININITPSFGIPLANLTITGGDFVKQLNTSASSNNFHVEYDKDELCIIVYDKTNTRITLPPVLPFDTTIIFPIDYFSDLRFEGLTLMQAFINMNVDNEYTKDITFQVKKLTYMDESGSENQAVTSGLNNTNIIKAAKTNDQPTRTQLFRDFLSIENPSDVINHGTDFQFGFDLNYDSLQNSGELNLNPIIKVPAWFIVENHLRMDTVSINLEDVSDVFNNETASLKTVTLYLTIDNGLPLEANLQVYFMDENYRLIDSLQSNEMHIPWGEISSYQLIKPTLASFEITMSKEKFKKIEKSKYLIFKEKYRSYAGRDVKLFKSNTLKVVLSAKVTTEVNGNISEITK